jgi:hypothetical protein
MDRPTTKSIEEIKVSTGSQLNGSSMKLYLPDNNEQVHSLDLKGNFSDCTFKDLYVENITGIEAQFRNCKFINCRFQQGSFESATFTDCWFESVRIKDVNLSTAKLEKTKFRNSRVEDVKNATKLIITQISIDRRTKIAIAELNKDTTDKSSFQSIKRSERRHDLKEGESSSLFTKQIARLFFLISDYGTSTYRVVVVTLVMILLFQRIYLIPYYLHWEPLVKNLENKTCGETLALVEIRALYFTVLTTAGVSFGDLTPMPTINAYLIVTLQIIVSYILLAAVIFRMARFFQD